MNYIIVIIIFKLFLFESWASNKLHFTHCGTNKFLKNKTDSFLMTSHVQCCDWITVQGQLRNLTPRSNVEGMSDLIKIPSVEVVKEGYSRVDINGHLRANGTCTLIRENGLNVIVDTLTAWDREFLLDELHKRNLTCEDITHVVCTHGHSDHIGNLNLFTKAIHIVGQCVSYEDKYELDHFEKGAPYIITDNIKVLPTPGHTLSDVSVFVNCPGSGVVVVAGDLFEREEDILDPKLWRVIAGSEDPELQLKNRKDILSQANHIIPGHGPMFKVTEDMIRIHNLQQI